MNTYKASEIEIITNIVCLFSTDLCDVNLHSYSEMFLYADDTAVLNYGKTIKEVQKNVQNNNNNNCDLYSA